MQELSLKTVFEKEGIPLESGSNHRFLLLDPDSVWYVASGRVDIFSVRAEGREQTGSRNYFFSLEAGGLIFGLNSDAYGQGRALLVVGTPATRLYHLPLARLKTCTEDQSLREEISRLIDQWIGGLSSGISKDINPETNLTIEQAGEVQIPASLKFRSRKGISWIRFMKGNGLFMGMKEVADHVTQLMFPVSNDTWIQTIGPGEVLACPTRQALDQDHFWEGMENFYEVIFFCEMLNTRLIMVDELNRLADKTAEEEKTRESAYHKIASVLNKAFGQSYLLGEETPLIHVCSLVAKYAGIELTIPKLADPEELRNLGLEDIVRSSKIRVRQVALPEKWWKKDIGPVVGFTQERNQPVAILPSGKNRYIYINPLIHQRIQVNQKVAETLKSGAYQMYRPFPDQSLNARDLVRFSLKGTRRDMILIFMAGIAGGLLTLMLPVLTGFLFDRIIPLSDFSGLFLVAFAMFVSALAIGLFQVVRSFAMIRVETKIDFQLQNALWDRILNLPVAFFKRFSSGDLASKANSLSVLRKILSSTVIYAIVSGTFGLFNYFVLFVYDPGLALMTTLILLLSMVLLVYTGVKIMKNQRNIIQQQNYISGLLIQFFYSISKLKIAGSEIAAYAMWADKFSKVKKATLKVKRYSNGLQLFMAALPVVATLFLFATISFNKKATLSTGEFMAFFTAFTMTITIILQVGMAGISLFTAIPLFENVKPILETLPENVKFKHEAPVLQGEIELNHVSFRYDPESPLVLKNISLHIGPGEYVAIVGPSGSGKSTLLRLLLGFESPENGAVYYDRQDLANLDPASIRRQIGSVLQETRLAPGNILSNITGTSSATMDDAWNAARKAGLDQDIHQMPMGMFTIVSDGLSTLSGGQRQRVLIARALVANPRILLLDEATSALDNETQRKVAQSLDNIPTTRLIIAHRLSTIKNADRIFVIDNGQLVEEGTYEELMKKNGYFYELVKRQSA